MKKHSMFLFLISALCFMLVLVTSCKKEEEEASIPIVEEDFKTELSEEIVDSILTEESSKQESSEASSEESSQYVEEQVSDQNIHDSNMNPLTGEIMDHPVSQQRPIAFMIDNHPDAVPQLGVSHADIIIEAIVEGGATRLMCVFQELPDDIVIGGVRSLRHDYIDFAAGLDAIVAHCGCSNLGYDALERRGYNDIEAISWAGYLFYRDDWRLDNMGYSHSLVTTGKAINEFLKTDAPYRTTHEEDYQCNLIFSKEPEVSNAIELQNVDVFFGDYRHTYFTFDPQTEEYYAEIYGDPYVDFATKEPVSFKNLLVIKTDVWVCDEYAHMDMELNGTGDGFFMVDGLCAPIIWTREDEDSQFVFTYPDGSPVVFGVGRTYFAVVDLNGSVD